MYQTAPNKTNGDQALPQGDPVNKSIVKEEQHCITHSNKHWIFLSIAIHLLELCKICNRSQYHLFVYEALDQSVI